MSTHEQYGDWEIAVEETSAGVYRVRAETADRRSVELTGTDPQHLVARAKREVDARTDVALETLDANGNREAIYLQAALYQPYSIDVRRADNTHKRYSEWSLWHTLLALRQELEDEGKLLLCVGSRPDVVVSGMSLDMTGGRNAYRVQMGQTAQRESLIDILLPAKPEEVGTIAQQVAQSEQWLASNKEQKPENNEQAR